MKAVLTGLSWLYWLACQLAGIAFYWWPVWIYHGHHVYLPFGLTVTFVLCMLKAWDDPYAPSIKPLANRANVDGWPWPFNALWGNPEDGVSGFYAWGLSWVGPYNVTRSRFKALRWNLRNWLTGYNYLTWRASWGVPPILTLGPIKLGWQPRYGRIVMVCGF